MIAEIGFTQNEKARNIAHELIIDPQAAHGVMDRRVNAHRRFIGIFPRDLFIHLKEVAIAAFNSLKTKALDGVGKIQIHAKAMIANAATLITYLFGRARADIARGEVAIAWIFALEII